MKGIEKPPSSCHGSTTSMASQVGFHALDDACAMRRAAMAHGSDRRHPATTDNIAAGAVWPDTRRDRDTACTRESPQSHCRYHHSRAPRTGPSTSDIPSLACASPRSTWGWRYHRPADMLEKDSLETRLWEASTSWAPKLQVRFDLPAGPKFPNHSWCVTPPACLEYSTWMVSSRQAWCGGGSGVACTRCPRVQERCKRWQNYRSNIR
jgi:hypothetical protein